MAVRKIIRMGHPTLRKAARRLEARELASPEIGRLVNDMIDTLNDSGGIGLAAPQIDESVRLAIIEIDGGPSRYGEVPAMPLTVFVNPTIEVVDPKPAGYWEGCLSVPGLRGFVAALAVPGLRKNVWRKRSPQSGAGEEGLGPGAL